MAVINVDYRVLSVSAQGGVDVEWTIGGDAFVINHPVPTDSRGLVFVGPALDAWFARAARAALLQRQKRSNNTGNANALRNASGTVAIDTGP